MSYNAIISIKGRKEKRELNSSTENQTLFYFIPQNQSPKEISWFITSQVNT